MRFSKSSRSKRRATVYRVAISAKKFLKEYSLNQRLFLTTSILAAGRAALNSDGRTQILDNDGNATVDIASSGLRLWAGTGVGVLGDTANPIDTTVTTPGAMVKDVNSLHLKRNNVAL